MHGLLLKDGRGSGKDPGAFRRSQTWLGGTRPGNAIHVPPPQQEMQICLGELEKFLHEDNTLPPLIKAGLLHLQFESIHPFLDGNGRLGRLLIALFLVEQQVLREPLLYLSLYLKTHRADYYRLLQEVRQRGTWEAWLEFFLTGVAATANNAHDSALRIMKLFSEDRARITSAGEQANSMLRVHALLQNQPFVNATRVVDKTGLSMPTVNSAMVGLERLGLVHEVTGKKRGRVYAYEAFLRIIDEGTNVT